MKSFFGGDEKHSPENNAAGFITQEKQLFQKLKSNLEAVRVSFQKESEDIIKASLQASTPKKGKESKQGAQAHSVLTRWNDSPLQLLINKAGYHIAANTLNEFINSAEYSRLKKMFLEVDLDFSGETAETNVAIKNFIDTFREFELWVQQRDELHRIGSMDPVLEDPYMGDKNVHEVDKQVSKFKTSCDNLAGAVQQGMKEVFDEVGRAPRNVAGLEAEMRQAQTKLEASTQEEYAILVKVIQTKRDELNKDRFQKVGSQFYKLYCDYNNKSIALGMDPAALSQSEVFKEMKLLLLGQEDVPAADLSAEKSEVKTAVTKLRGVLSQFDAMSKDKLFLLAYPDSRDSAYQPPTPR